MKRLRKSAKALIISVVSAVCVLAIVLGCIFGLRKPTPTPQVASAIDLLGEEINNAVSKPNGYQIFEGAPYAGVPEAENGDAINEFKSNYFIVNVDLSEGNNIKDFYTFRKKLDGTGYDTRNLTAKVSEGGFVHGDAVSYEIRSYNEKYLVIVNHFVSMPTDENEIDNAMKQDLTTQTFTFVDFSNFDNVKVLLDNHKFSTNEKPLYVDDISFEDGFCFVDTSKWIFESDYEPGTSPETVDLNFVYFYFELRGSKVNDSDIKSKTIAINAGDFNHERVYYSADADALIYEDAEKLHISIFKNGEIHDYETNLNSKKVKEVFKISENKFFVEYEKASSLDNANSVKVEDDPSGKVVEYVYEILDISSGNIVQKPYVLESGYAKAELRNVGESQKYYYIYQQKLGQNHELIYDFLNFYYAENGNMIVCYPSETIGEEAKFYKSGYFFTYHQIFKAENSTKVNQICKFVVDTTSEEGYELLYFDINSDSVVVAKDGNRGIMNYRGNLIIDPVSSIFTSISKIVDGYAIGVSGGEYFLIDASTGDSKLIENYFSDFDAFASGYNFYFTYDETAEEFSILSTNGTKLQSGISKVKNVKGSILSCILNKVNGVLFLFDSNVPDFSIFNSVEESANMYSYNSNHTVNSSSKDTGNYSSLTYNSSFPWSFSCDDDWWAGTVAGEDYINFEWWGTSGIYNSDPWDLKDKKEGNKVGTVRHSRHHTRGGGPNCCDYYEIVMLPGLYIKNSKVFEAKYRNALTFDINTNLPNGSNLTEFSYDITAYRGNDSSNERMKNDIQIKYAGQNDPLYLVYYFCVRGEYKTSSPVWLGNVTGVYDIEVGEFAQTSYFMGDSGNYETKEKNDLTVNMIKRHTNTVATHKTLKATDTIDMLFTVGYNEDSNNEIDDSKLNQISGGHIDSWYYDDRNYTKITNILGIPFSKQIENGYKPQGASPYDGNTLVNNSDFTILSMGNNNSVYHNFLRTYYWAYYKPNIYKINIDNKLDGAEGSDGKDENENPFTSFYLKYDTGFYKILENGDTKNDSAISSVPLPTKLGYSFGGYYTKPNGQGTKVVDSSGEFTSGATTFEKGIYYYSKQYAGANIEGVEDDIYTEGVTLYSYWIPIHYKLSFELGKRADGGILTGYSSGTLDPTNSLVLRSDLSDGVGVFKVKSSNLYYPSSNGASIGRIYTGDVEILEYYTMKNAQRRLPAYTTWNNASSVNFVFAGTEMYPVDFSNWVSTGESGLFDIVNPNLTIFYDILNDDRPQLDTEEYYSSNKDNRYGYAHYPRRGASKADYYYRGDIYKIVEKDRDDGWKEHGYSNLDYINNPQISVIQSQYVFDGWAYLDKDNNTLVKIDNYTKIFDAIEAELWDDDKNIEISDTLTLYATYREKDYKIKTENAAAGGSVSTNDSVENINNNALIANVEWTISNNNGQLGDILKSTCQFEREVNTVIGYGQNNYIPKGGQNITVKLTIPQNVDKQAYRFRHVDLSYLGYCTGGQNFAFANLIFEWDNSEGIWKMYNAGSEDDLTCFVNSKVYTLVKNKGSSVDIVANGTTTYKFGVNNYPVSDAGSYNYLTFSEATSTTLTFTVHNAMIAGNKDLSSASLAGEYGFTCTAYAVSNFNTPDTVGSISGSYNNEASAEIFYVVPKQYVKDSESPWASWFNGIYASIEGKSAGYYFIDSSNTISSGNATFYYDGTNLYYIANATNPLKMNFGSTELIAIRPSQSKIWLSENSSSSTQNAFGIYDLNEYLSSITIGGSIFSFEKFNRTLVNSTGDKLYYYSDLKLNGCASNLYTANGSINYLGATYTFCDARRFETNGRTFVLILAQRTDTDTNEVMYFIYTDMAGNNASVDISLQFKSITSNLNVNDQTNKNDIIKTDKYNDGDAAVLSKAEFLENGNVSKYSKVNNYSTSKPSYKPSDLFFFSIAPADGYLINSITFTLKEETLFKATLDHNNLVLNYSGSTYSYISSTGTTTNGINYTDVSGSAFAGANTFDRKLTEGSVNGVWFTGSSGGNWVNSISSFETLYFMVAGLYDDLTINVEMISYAEYIVTSSETNPLKMTAGAKGSANLGNLTIAVGNTKIASSEVQIRTISNGQGDHASMYRVIFLGNAAKLQGGVTIYATGENYSYEFNNFQFYNNSTRYSMGNAGVNGNVLCITTPKFIEYKGETNSGQVNTKQINAKKNIFAASLSRHSFEITSKSYLKNDNGNIEFNNVKYQVDNKNKSGSWFNDTVLSNIDYGFFANEFASISTRNWQSLDGQDSSGKNLYVYNTYNITKNSYGYGVTITYYEIPGYSLSGININGNPIGTISSKGLTGKTVGEISYSLTYDNSNNDGKFVLKLYVAKDDRSVQDDLDSINTALANLNIEFYSDPYEVVLKLDRNVGSSSSASTYSITSSECRITYDTLTTIPNTPSMTGYTFVGWASEKAGGKVRLNNGVWDSSSKWTDIRNLFDPLPKDNRSNLLKVGIGGNVTGYDFYVKNGYFITDTGFGSSENYNFWNANAKAFNSTVGTYRDDKWYNGIAINLYAIWKANTYRIEFDLNDARLDGSNIAKYGSTQAQLSKRSSSNYGIFGTNYIADNSRVILAGKLKETSNTYYAYVTFDSNDWYITTSNIAYKGDYTSYVQGDNMLDFVVDRYGYSWLGWTSASKPRITSGAVDNASTIFASSYNNSKTSKKIEAPKLSKALYDTLQISGDAAGANKINPEFYYAGAHSIQEGYTNKNVVFYFYEASGKATSDYLNIQNGVNKIVGINTSATQTVGVAYFDTSLNASAYSFEEDKVKYKITDGTPYRSIRLYAYWQANAYTFEINFRDSLTNIVLNKIETQLGSSEVTNKNFVQNKLNSVTCYFDDAAYADVLNAAVPVRIGYDFVGWSYRFDSQGQNAYTWSQAFSKDHFLNQTLLNGYNTTGTTGNSVLTTGAGTDDSKKYTSYEAFGDSETEHKVYIFAIWKAQKFTVNFSLNIGGENLKNLYDLDSTFAIALYNSSSSNVYNNTYSGIGQTNFTNADSSRDLTFGEIVANVVFTATFDDLIGNSYFKFGGKTYHLKDLFATSAGYYFLGWLTDPSSASSSKLVSNTSKSKFDEAGNLVNVGNVDNVVVTSIAEGRTTFNLNMFNNLFNSNYKLINSSDASYFLNSNKNALNSIDASGASSNYGYLTIGGQRYYIAHEYLNEDKTSQRLYYIINGEKIYVQISERNNDLTPKGGIEYDDAFMYMTKDNRNVSGKYIIRFCDTYSSGYNAYYINSQGEKVELLLRCRLVGSSWNTDSYVSSWDDSFVPCTTRQFTLYADWELRTDLVADIANGNNGKGDDLSEQDSSSNSGLAGHFHVTNKDTNENKTTAGGIETEQTLGYNEKSINIGYDYYQGLKFDIIPYFNGRYLSEMKLTYHVIEWLGGKYVKVPYTLVLKFTWSNVDSIMRLNSKTSVSVYKAGKLISPEIELSTTGSVTSSITQIIKESSALTKLSMIDRAVKNGTMQSFGFAVDSYADDYSSLESTYGRRDVNKLSFELENVGSEIEISCKFSVQTFDVKIYNLFDNNGNTLKQRELSSVYDTAYTSEANFFADVQASSSGSFGPLIASDPSNYQWVSANGQLVRMATISTDCADESIFDSYNVPYGYFLYGVYYNTDAQKPTDKREGDVRVNVNQPFGGYEYIYANGNYYAGETSVKLETIGSDEFYMQNTPTLGSRGAFPEQSFMLNLTTYQFLHWFEYTPDSNGNVVFTEYDESSESKYLNRNLTLYGYYFSQNKPTSVQFYTWDKDAYKYTELNSEGKYILNSNTSDSPFKIEGGKVVINEEMKDYIDNDGLARVKTYNEYGVNQVRFGNDNFRNLELNTSDLTFISKLLRTYWYMEDSYDVLYFVNSANENVYIKYSTAENYFYYENETGNEVRLNSLNSNDLEYFTCMVDGKVTPLEIEKRYVYQLDGSKMYIKIAVNGNDRYYELKAVTDEENSRYYASSGALPRVMDYAPRYYVDINGSRYYMMLRNLSSGGTPDRLYNEAGSLVNSLFDTSYTVENIDDYYVVYEDVYHKIEYSQISDSGSSNYINPYTRTSYVTINVWVADPEGELKEIELPLVFDYQTKNLEQDIADPVEVDYWLYTAVNDNYSPSYSTSNDKWEITGITISKLPSPNSGSWYEDAEYGFVSFIKFTDTDLEQLKQRDETSLNTDQQRIYAVFADHINNRRQASLAGLSEDELEELKNSVSTKISEYTMRDLLSKLITVSQYIYGTDGQINKLIANIPITFDGLRYNSTAEPISLTVTVNYKFDVVRARQTKVDDNIYAIPIYSPYVMQFASSASASGSTVSIDLEKTRVSHFEVSNSVHIYNDESDPLNFVVLNADQYAEWISVSEHPDGRLTTLLSNNSYMTDLGIQYKLGTDENKNITFNFAGLSGDYYIVMFYYKYSSTIPIGSRTSVTRVSDDIIKVSSDGSSATIQKVDRGQR